ncbi:LiaG family protein [Neobacillus sp. Marseille-QA0830]
MKRIFVLLLVITGLYILFNRPIHLDVFNNSKANGTADITNDTQVIKLNVSSARATIIPEDRPNLRAVYNGKQKLKITDSGDTVVVSLKGSWFNWGSAKSNLTIYIPKDYNRDLNIDLGSGSLQFSGSEKTSMTLDDVTAHIGSGKMDVSNLEVNHLKQDVSSGVVKLDSVVAKTGTFNVTSGKLDINHYNGAVNADVTSGLFNIQLDQLTDSVTMDVSSGAVNLDLPENADFTLQSDISSGNISCDFPLTEKESGNKSVNGKHGSGKYNIKLDVASGDIDIF